MLSLSIDYKQLKSPLCEIGKKYDTDKSSQRQNVTDERHCHPYTLFYDGLFRNKRHEPLKIAELGILDGSSLLMWREYFPNAQIHGFEYYSHLINNFKIRYNNDRITLHHIDVTNQDSIKNTFANVNEIYDIIIEDTTHQFDDQIRVIKNAYKYLKPGGIFIIEDIFKAYDEKNYAKQLGSYLNYFWNYYFVTLEHANKKSTGWDNDKLLVLVKKGAPPIFLNENKLTIITPSYRTDNLLKIKKSINFYYVDEWIIVYDGNKITKNPNLFANDDENKKIKEYVYKGEGISGNPQRNFALTKISNHNTLLYYVDDDNIINPQLYGLMNIIQKDRMYTFNQDSVHHFKGDNIKVGHIDTGMFIIDYNLCKNITWNNHLYDADGHYIEECYQNNKDKHIFINNELCYYNHLNI